MKDGRRKTYLKVFINMAIMLVTILCCIFVLPRIIVYFMPFVIGWIIALIASPMVSFFERKLKIKRRAGSAVVIIAVIALVILAGYFTGAWIAEQMAEFVEDIPQLWESAQEDFQQIGDRLSVAFGYLPVEVQRTITHIRDNIQEYAGGLVGTAGEPTLEALSRFAEGLPNIIIGTIMCLLFAYFYVADREYISNLLERMLPGAIIERFAMIKRGFTGAVGGYFKAQLKIEVWMYLLLLLGFTVLKVKYAFIIALGVAFLDLLPFFGTGTVLLPWSLVKFLSGDYRIVVGLLIIWGVGQLARQIIQPKIVGDEVGLSPIPTIFLLYIGYKAAGVIGMIIAVPIGIIVLHLYQEGVFDTTLDSLKVLYADISNFRHLTDEDMKGVEEYKERERERIRQKKEHRDR